MLITDYYTSYTHFTCHLSQSRAFAVYHKCLIPNYVRNVRIYEPPREQTRTDYRGSSVLCPKAQDTGLTGGAELGGDQRTRKQKDFLHLPPKTNKK